MNDQISGSPFEETPSATWPHVLVRWCAEGARAAAFMRPQWQGLPATPMAVAVLMAATLALNVLFQRLYIVGPADFYWQAITSGWFASALLAWVSYVMRPHPLSQSVPDAAPSAVHLFTMLLAQFLVVSAVCGVFFVALVRNGLYTNDTLGTYGIWVLWLGPAVWLVLSRLVLLIRSGDRKPKAVAVATLIVIGVSALDYAVQPSEFWYEPQATSRADRSRQLRLTQEVMEAQQPLLAQRLNDIQPQRPGVVDLYALSFAPYAQEDVFRRESDMVSQVMSQRFDAGGRILQLVNHVETLETWPWATPLNLRRAIQRLADLMDREEDILFIHLTSHGARDGELAASFRPMEVSPLKPADLRAWLDEAGIKHRVISISACYSGSWIPALADENTLVMTAADAEHTSYGCGRKSELTFFGRAMYDEQLRNNTLSFEEAHSAARTIIKKREEEAGKDDGYSNPQIDVGANIRQQLAQVQARLQRDSRNQK
jgi:hypothetical protein